ncbi:MAG: hypothetical protein ACREF9_04585 [Opitutaceae bacterium]
MSSRNLSCAFGVFLGGCLAAGPTYAQMRAESPVAPDSITLPDATLPSESATLRSWELSGNVRGVAGYKDNLLLSAQQPDESLFVRTDAEMFWWRLPTERFEATAFANAIATHFLDATADKDELEAFVHGEARWFIAPSFRTTLNAEGYYLDQVFDLSTSSAARQVAQLQVTGGLASVILHWQLGPKTSLALKPGVQRDRYRDRSDDHRQRNASFTLTRQLGSHVEIAVEGRTMRRDYDYRTLFTSTGRSLAGTQLEFHQREGELRLDVTWDEAQHWKTLTKIGGHDNRDSGSGYFDYDYRWAKQELRWRRDAWQARLAARAGRYDYALQTVGIGILPPTRLREDFAAELHLERKFNERVRIFGAYQWERSRSNDPVTGYRVNTVFAGVDWSL